MAINLPEGDCLLGLGIPGNGFPNNGPIAIPTGLLHRAPVVKVDAAQSCLLVGDCKHEDAGKDDGGDDADPDIDVEGRDQCDPLG